jgi:hypothetical protein
MTSPDAAHGMVIDLGTVNGTALITVNSTVVGSRIMDQPGWDIADLLRSGRTP